VPDEEHDRHEWRSKKLDALKEIYGNRTTPENRGVPDTSLDYTSDDEVQAAGGGDL
jgi:hypothetical protein